MMRGRVIVMSLLIVIVAACTAEGENQAGAPSSTQDSPTANPSTEPARLPAQERLGAAYRIARADLQPSDAVRQLGDALDAEMELPTPGRRYGWFDYSETLQQAYMTALVGLGPEAVPEITQRAASARGPVRGWYVVALGYLGEDVDQDLLDLLADHPGRPVSAHAISLVGRRRILAAVPVLRAYLEDDFGVSDPHRPDRPPNYPLRDIAAGALRQLGFTVYSPPERPWEYQVVDQ